MDVVLAAGLRVVAIVGDRLAAVVLARVIGGRGDWLRIAQDPAQGLELIATERPDLVFLELTLDPAEASSLLQRVRGLCPSALTCVIQAAGPQHAEQVSVPVGAATLGLPLDPEAVLAALTTARERRKGDVRRAAASTSQTDHRRAASLTTELAELADASSQRVAAEGILTLVARRLGTRRAFVYLGAGEASRQLMRTAALGADGSEPPFCDELELLKYAKEQELEVVRLALRREQFGLILIGGLPSGDETEALLELTGSVATLVLVLVGAREQSHRGAMKDPESSAYTFSYFVDVASRELDLARRHGGRLALAVLGVEVVQGKRAASNGEPTLVAAERVLGTMRDTDVVARVDAHEFYLLLPQTDGLGAQACRRRVLEQLNAPGVLEACMGLAIFPQDGDDLSRLVRVAKQRADASVRSLVMRLGLQALNLSAVLDTLVEAVGASTPAPELDAARYIEVATTEAVALVLSAVREAARAGKTRVVATQHPGVSLAGAVRAEIGRELESVSLEVVETSGGPGDPALDVLVIVAQHTTYVLLGRARGGVMRAIHSTDPLLADLVLASLSDVSARVFAA